MATGMGRGVPFGKPIGQPQSTWMRPTNPVGDVYSAAVHQQAGDYDKIMGGYDDLLSSSRTASKSQVPLAYKPISPTNVGFNAGPTYQQSGQLQQVGNQLSDMSRTGGYSESDLGALRSRGIAPTKSIYASAVRNMNRQKSLSGGYSPNFGALQAKLAREQSGIIGTQNIAVNADIADKVAQGKQFGLSNLAPIAQRSSELTHESNARNASEAQRVNELNVKNKTDAEMFNRNAELQYNQQNNANQTNTANQGLNALQGKASMYAASPGLVNTFGNQVLQSGAQDLAGQQATAGIQQNRANTGLQLIGSSQNAPPRATAATRAPVQSTVKSASSYSNPWNPTGNYTSPNRGGMSVPARSWNWGG